MNDAAEFVRHTAVEAVRLYFEPLKRFSQLLGDSKRVFLSDVARDVTRTIAQPRAPKQPQNFVELSEKFFEDAAIVRSAQWRGEMGDEESFLALVRIHERAQRIAAFQCRALPEQTRNTVASIAVAMILSDDAINMAANAQSRGPYIAGVVQRALEFYAGGETPTPAMDIWFESMISFGEAVGQLPPLHHALFLARFRDELAITEISQQFGISFSEAAQQLVVILNLLHSRLDPYDYGATVFQQTPHQGGSPQIR